MEEVTPPVEPVGGRPAIAWTADEVRAFLGHYSMRPRRLRVTQLKSWWWNLVLLVEADEQRLVLRRYGITPAEEVLWELALLEHLLAHGFPTFSPLRRTDGATLGSFGGKPAILYPFVEGNNGCQSVDPLHAMTETAKLVARMHDLTRDLVLSHPRVHSGSDSRRTIRQLLQFVQEHGLASPEHDLRELATHAARYLDAFEARLAPYERDLPRGIVHHDAHCANVLFHDGRLVALIDFDDACPGYLIADLAVMLANWAEDRHSHGLVGNRATQLLRAYEQHRPLTGVERELLPDFLVLFTLSDAAAHVQGQLEQGVPASVAVSECHRYRSFLQHIADPNWRSMLDIGGMTGRAGNEAAVS